MITPKASVQPKASPRNQHYSRSSERDGESKTIPLEQLRKLWFPFPNGEASTSPLNGSEENQLANTAASVDDDDDDLSDDIKALVRSFEEKVRDVFQLPQNTSLSSSCDSEPPIPPDRPIVVQTSNEEVKRLEAELSQTKQELNGALQREQRLLMELAGLKQLYEKEVRTRRMINDELMAIKGNIRVFVRVRPYRAPTDPELIKLGKAVQVVDGATVALLPQNKRYEFDACIDETIDQQSIFDAHVAPLVMHVLDGTNCTLIAYGQTGSGKTHTMLGTKENPGMNRRALQRAFELARSTPMQQFKFNVSIFQVYNETLQDLLSASSIVENLDIRQHPETKQVFVKGLTKIEVTDASQVESLLDAAQKRRAVGGHAMNDTSSRSHLVLTLEVNGKSNLVLIDLAGSERASRTEATGDRLRESQYINKSLSALGDVLQSLGDKQKRQHYPFRNSKLTYFLQDILSGNSKVAFFACISPEYESNSETYCTLDFAERIRRVELLTTSLALSKTPNARQKSAAVKGS